jgi:hypothetical protein
MLQRSRMMNASREVKQDGGDKRFHRIRDLRHPNGEGLCERGRGGRKIRQFQQELRGRQKRVLFRNGPFHERHGVFPWASMQVVVIAAGGLLHHARHD